MAPYNNQIGVTDTHLHNILSLGSNFLLKGAGSHQNWRTFSILVVVVVKGTTLCKIFIHWQQKMCQYSYNHCTGEKLISCARWNNVRLYTFFSVKKNKRILFSFIKNKNIFFFTFPKALVVVWFEWTKIVYRLVVLCVVVVQMTNETKA